MVVASDGLPQDGLPQLSDAQVAAYLGRIGCPQVTEPSASVLAGLHRAHMLTIPFESYDCALGRPVSVDPLASLAKIVDRRRGGFCYELNLPFGALLRTLGYGVELLGCRPFLRAQPGHVEADGAHVALRVTVAGERWLADVGFGDSFLEPLRLDTDVVQIREEGRGYRVAQAGYVPRADNPAPLDPAASDGRGVMIQEYGGEHQEAFDLASGWTVAGFAQQCRIQSTEPGSWFVASPTCTIATSTGRVSLVGRSRLITRANGVRTERPILDTADEMAVLREVFGVELLRLRR